jgi:hypothetical protein
MSKQAEPIQEEILPPVRTSRRFQANRTMKLLVPILLGALVLILIGVIVVTVMAVMGVLPG